MKLEKKETIEIAPMSPFHFDSTFLNQVTFRAVIPNGNQEKDGKPCFGEERG